MKLAYLHSLARLFQPPVFEHWGQVDVQMGIIMVGDHPSCLYPSVYPHMTRFKFPRPSPSVLAYCKRLKVGMAWE